MVGETKTKHRFVSDERLAKDGEAGAKEERLCCAMDGMNDLPYEHSSGITLEESPLLFSVRGFFFGSLESGQ